MASLGERLRQERLAKGIELSQIAAQTRINLRYLQAIEADDVKTLPGGLIGRSFARQYAGCLGIDEREIEAEVQRLLAVEAPVPAPTPAPPGLLFEVSPIPMAVGLPTTWNRRLPRAVLLLVAVVAACSLLYAFWMRAQRASGSTPKQEAVNAPAAAPPQATMKPAEPSRSPQQPPARPADDGGLSLEITAKEKTWLSVTSNGKTLFSDTLEPGQTKTLRAGKRARLLIGNAGGLEILANGKSIGPIGPMGHTRVVELTPEGSQVLTTVKPGSEPGAPEQPESLPPVR